uniref:Uncharacterized protein n=1 Tax=Anguilla anguilla TaxID=7936 RepID=A0A0E9PC22_ANGAN
MIPNACQKLCEPKSN